MRCRMYDFVYTTDLGVNLLVYRQDRHRIRADRNSAQLQRSLSYIRGGITAGGLCVSWAGILVQMIISAIDLEY